MCCDRLALAIVCRSNRRPARWTCTGARRRTQRLWPSPTAMAPATATFRTTRLALGQNPELYFRASQQIVSESHKVQRRIERCGTPIADQYVVYMRPHFEWETQQCESKQCGVALCRRFGTIRFGGQNSAKSRRKTKECARARARESLTFCVWDNMFLGPQIIFSDSPPLRI